MSENMCSEWNFFQKLVESTSILQVSSATKDFLSLSISIFSTHI